MNDDILTKFMLGETSAEEDVKVNQWFREDRENEKYFKDLKLIWETSRKFASSSFVDENVAWDSFKEKREVLEKTEAKVIFMQPSFTWYKIAAAVLLLVIAGVALNNFFGDKGTRPVAMKKIQSGSEVKIQTLPDGSIVTLNRNSTLTFPEKFKGGQREIELEGGEAFFNVTPDKAKPFIVNTKDISIRVVGTSFNVKEEKNETEVIVETGVVSVSKKANAIELKAKEKLSIRKTDASFSKVNNVDELHNYYRTKQLTADNTPLWRVVEVLNQAYDAHIVIEGNKLRDLPLSTTFRLDNSIDNVLSVISETLNVKVVKSKGQIILK